MNLSLRAAMVAVLLTERFMKITALAIAAALTTFAFGACAHDWKHPKKPKEPVTVKIIGFNDYHGNLESPGTFGANTTVPTAQRPPVGGADAMAAYVQRLKESNPNHVVVGAGDFIGATPLISALFFDEPAVETLNKIGLEFNAVGNHEFDRGSAELKRLQRGGCKVTDGATDPNSCRGFGSAAPGTFDGAHFRWLSANVIETRTGRPLLKPYGIKRFPGGIKVAFIGMTLKATPTIVTPTGVAGLEFRDEADTVNALVPELKRHRNVDAIVVLVHQGGFPNGAGNASDINGCVGDLKNNDGSDSEVRKIVSRLDDAVDLVISGHTHAAYNCSASTVDVVAVNGAPVATPRPTGLPNAKGRLVPVTSSSAFGRVLTDIDLTFERRSGELLSVVPTNRLVDRNDPDIQQRIAADPSVKNVVDAYRAAVSPLANAVIGTIAAPLPNVGDAAGEMPAGALIADAQLAATQPAALGGAVMAFMNPGGVRNPGFAFAGATYPYNVTYGNAFTVQPFGNSLVTMTLTATQLKALLEQQFVGCNGQTQQRILQVSNGIRYSWSASAAPCSKIVDMTLTPTDVTVVPPLPTAGPEQIVSNGTVVSPTKTYRVTVNNFLATGGDAFTTLLAGTSVLGGAQDIDALVAYMGGYKAPAAPYDPAFSGLAKPRITRVP
jgi:5'-nucleotidase